LSAVRVFYRLQVRAAPAVASFLRRADHAPVLPLHRSPEGLGHHRGGQAAPPLYCPDPAVTLGQMAVCLSTALGLHFAP
jgi:hypothetical protein